VRHTRLRQAFLAACALATVCAAPPAHAAEGLVVGLADNALKYDAARAQAAYRALGVGGVRLVATWRGESALGGTEQAWLDRAMTAAGAGTRVVLAVYGAPELAPTDGAARER
jgi:hypothetical protein